MRIVDLTHPWGIHTPGWVGYPGGKMYYTQNLRQIRLCLSASRPRCIRGLISTARCTARTVGWTWHPCR